MIHDYPCHVEDPESSRAPYVRGLGINLLICIGNCTCVEVLDRFLLDVRGYFLEAMVCWEGKGSLSSRVWVFICGFRKTVVQISAMSIGFQKKLGYIPFFLYIYISNCNYDATVFEHDPQCISRLVNS